MVVSLKMDLRFPIPGQQGHGGRIIHLSNDINPSTFYNWVKRLSKNGCGDIPEKNQLSTYEQSHQGVVKIEMNSISVPNDMNKNTDTAAMELMIGNMNLRISNETDPLLLAKTIQILTELSC